MTTPHLDAIIMALWRSKDDLRQQQNTLQDVYGILADGRYSAVTQAQAQASIPKLKANIAELQQQITELEATLKLQQAKQDKTL